MVLINAYQQGTKINVAVNDQVLKKILVCIGLEYYKALLISLSTSFLHPGLHLGRGE